MIRDLFGRLMFAVILSLILLAGSQSQGEPTPAGPKWWPSPWGAEDQRGALNRITSAKVLEATRLIKKGKVYELGRVYEKGIPLAGGRFFSLTIPGVPTSGPIGSNSLVSNDELFSGQIGQVGTQMDGLGHVGVRVGDDDIFYNGFRLSDFGDANGLKKLGVENMGPVFTRGVLLDVARAVGVRRLQSGHTITPQELEEAAKVAGVKIGSGDVVLIHTGHGQLWMVDNEEYNAGEPGIGMAAARWLTDRDVAMIGSDNWGIEVVPFEGEDMIAPIHQWTLTRHGVYHLENLNLSQLAADRVSEFALIYIPLPLKGATGSPGSPIAVR